MRSFGRALQMVGLAVLPLGSFLQLTNAITLGQMLTMLVAGACIFGIGVILQRVYSLTRRRAVGRGAAACNAAKKLRF